MVLKFKKTRSVSTKTYQCFNNKTIQNVFIFNDEIIQCFCELPCVQEGRAAPAVPPHSYTHLLLWPHEWMDTEEMHTNPSHVKTKGSTPTKSSEKGGNL